MKYEWLTVEEVADMLRLNTVTIYRWLRTNKLRGIKLGKEWRIKDSDLQEFLESHYNDA
ncbi:helix-turn-helix domain-containing protein [Garciella nitratireducens]|uniref:DNA binding domain-containing protein, excisionase family n=1 Tax=Garciella nitratireducens DSM 15102 TaxID=1121911 RepID=A0A1T4P6M5_9FIRM|nr:helix-turn-helix domain-containing protein [Garciella nitratireducens]RBP42207.1 excisionase family DNA binding protein [Garciella nitratireducens]SJZ87109.1 DNA binding domain-containing protein, excisionase family [Garciella nitratireducens DSM 15102]